MEDTIPQASNETKEDTPHYPDVECKNCRLKGLCETLQQYEDVSSVAVLSCN